jgi:hypothetical protein
VKAIFDSKLIGRMDPMPKLKNQNVRLNELPNPKNQTIRINQLSYPFEKPSPV